MRPITAASLGLLLIQPLSAESKSLLGRSPKAPTPIPARNDFASVAEDSGSLFGELYFGARVSVDYAVEPK